jgi:hypothetical protein
MQKVTPAGVPDVVSLDALDIERIVKRVFRTIFERD